jgi:hypothetical protein
MQTYGELAREVIERGSDEINVRAFGRKVGVSDLEEMDPGYLETSATVRIRGRSFSIHETVNGWEMAVYDEKGRPIFQEIVGVENVSALDLLGSAYAQTGPVEDRK